ncbi:hypothetical protein HMPREF1583_00926 [Gardnerella vaginalis JCP8151B]|nr:hypothetical protein HMPREF1583_00926 [Gardnerella vaginalis JCP8151B]
MCWCALTFVREGSQATEHYATKHFNNKTKSHIIITTMPVMLQNITLCEC